MVQRTASRPAVLPALLGLAALLGLFAMHVLTAPGFAAGHADCHAQLAGPMLGSDHANHGEPVLLTADTTDVIGPATGGTTPGSEALIGICLAVVVAAAVLIRLRRPGPAGLLRTRCARPAPPRRSRPERPPPRLASLSIQRC